MSGFLYGRLIMTIVAKRTAAVEKYDGPVFPGNETGLVSDASTMLRHAAFRLQKQFRGDETEFAKHVHLKKFRIIADMTPIKERKQSAPGAFGGKRRAVEHDSVSGDPDAANRNWHRNRN